MPSRSRQAAEQSARRGLTSETADKDQINHLDEDFRREAHLQMKRNAFTSDFLLAFMIILILFTNLNNISKV